MAFLNIVFFWRKLYYFYLHECLYIFIFKNNFVCWDYSVWIKLKLLVSEIQPLIYHTVHNIIIFWKMKLHLNNTIVSNYILCIWNFEHFFLVKIYLEHCPRLLLFLFLWCFVYNDSITHSLNNDKNIDD